MLSRFIITAFLLSTVGLGAAPSKHFTCQKVQENILMGLGPEVIEFSHIVEDNKHKRVYFNLLGEDRDYIVLVIWKIPGSHLSIPDKLLRAISQGMCEDENGKIVPARLDEVVPANVPKKG